MWKSLYGFQADFIQQGKTGMLLTRKQAVHTDELDNYQVNMLRYNTIPHLLPLEVRAVDFEVSFLYDISGKKMLEQVLRSGKMNASQYFEWMFQLVNLLHECYTYMLHPNQILLHERYLFVEGQLWEGNLQAAYLPLLQPLHPQAGIEGLKRLGILLSAHVNQWSGNGFQRLIHLLSQEDTSLVAVRQLLQTVVVSLMPVTEHEHVTTTKDELWKNRRSKEQYEQDIVQAQSIWEKGPTSFAHTSQPELVEPEESKRTILITTTVVAVAIAGWYVGFLSHPTRIYFLLSFGWSVAVLLFGFSWITHFSLPWKMKCSVIEPADHEPIKEVLRSPAGSHRNDTINEEPTYTSAATDISLAFSAQDELSRQTKKEINHYTSNIQPEQLENYHFNQQSVSTFKTNYYTELTKDTAVLAHSDDITDSLSMAKPERITKRSTPYLQRLDDTGTETIEKIPLHVFPFIIGRAEQGVHYRNEGVNISRHHCEFSCSEGGQYEIRDLGSKNGTQLHGELLIPYKTYSLQDGDKLAFAQFMYRYHVG